MLSAADTVIRRASSSAFLRSASSILADTTPGETLGFTWMWLITPRTPATLRAHASALLRLPRLLLERRRIFASRRIDVKRFVELLKRHAISVRQVASL